MSIKRIKIKNVRGIPSSGLEISERLSPNKPIFFVAPNGFGKTSIATAFNCLKTNKLDVTEEKKHNNDLNNESVIEIEDEEKTYVANEKTNSINSKYKIMVINTQVKPKAITYNYGNFPTSTSSLVVEPIVLYSTIPKTKKVSYAFSEIKRGFNGSSSKLVQNLSHKFKEIKFVNKFLDLKKDFNKLQQIRNSQNLNNFIDKINDISGTKEEIAKRDLGDRSLLDIESFKNIVENLNEIFSVMSFNEKVVNVYQLIYVFENNKDSITDITKYYNFMSDKKDISEMLELLNCTWKEIKAFNKKGKFIIEFPKANQISNGERDILCFVGKLFEAKLKLRKENCILIFDEIFDYLDDANLISAQYFIIKFINQFKKNNQNLYPIILTHLDPEYFKTYNFSTKNIIYLDKVKQVSNKFKINKLLINRPNCKMVDEESYNIISSNYLHYSVNNEDAKQYLSELGIGNELLKPEDFRKVALQELENYKEGIEYDLALVCAGLRILIEKSAYEQLKPEEKFKFLKEFKTIDKLKFAKENGAFIPETHFLLSIIYNECMHLDPQSKRLNPIAIKLKNKVIKKMISEI